MGSSYNVEVTRLLALAVLLGGCHKILDLERLPDARSDRGTGSDARGIDDMIVDADCPYGRFGRHGPSDSGLLDVCLKSPPAHEMFTSSSIDTTGTKDCSMVIVQSDSNKSEVCVITAVDMKFATATQAHGSRPLVLVATSTIEIMTSVSVASRGSARSGAGAQHDDCVIAGLDGVVAASMSGIYGGGGGGAGGSFGSLGGNGGSGSGIGGAAGGIVASPTFVRGGCRGGSGGAVGGAQPTGSGSGGGAIYLIAGTSILVRSTGTIDASGAGGRGGCKGINEFGGCGGGGGGSGGLIGLDAPMIVLEKNAKLVANGGGGGGGGGNGNTTDGANGHDPDLAHHPFAALGGPTVTPGGAGATVAQSATAGMTTAGAAGGGGGGGGHGHIVVFSPLVNDQGALVSPATL